MLDTAGAASRRLHVNAHFPELPWPDAFIERFRDHARRNAPVSVGIVASDRALYATAAILAASGLTTATNLMQSAGQGPFTRILGSMGRTAFDAAIQRTDRSRRADGSPEILIDFRVQVVFAAGVLTLLSPAGPVVWTANGNRVRSPDQPLWESIGDATPVTAEQLLEERIQANRRAIEALVADAGAGATPDRQQPVHLLTVSRLLESEARAVEKPPS